jgi:hypothetical protein
MCIKPPHIFSRDRLHNLGARTFTGLGERSPNRDRHFGVVGD